MAATEGHVPRARAPQQEKPTHHKRSPQLATREKSAQGIEDTAQPKKKKNSINKIINPPLEILKSIETDSKNEWFHNA